MKTTTSAVAADLARLERALRDEDVGEDARAELEPFLHEGFVVERSATPDGKLVVGATKIGGDPDLPRDAAWPTYGRKKTPLSFMAQIKLDDLPSVQGRERLPDTGLLSFFYALHASELTTGCVVYTPKTQKLSRAKPPKLAEPNVFGGDVPLATRPCAVTALEPKLFVEKDAPWFTDFDPADAIAPLFQLKKRPAHVVLGAATMISPSELAKPRKRWLHLLQLASDDVAGIDFGEVGTISYWMDLADLEKTAFDRARILFECA